MIADVERVLVSEEQIKEAVARIAAQIEADFDSGKIADLEELRKDEHWVNSNFYKIYSFAKSSMFWLKR